MTRPTLLAYAAVLVTLLIASAIGAHEPGTWAMEVAPVFIALLLMLATHRRFPLTPLLYGLIALHMAAPIGRWHDQHISGLPATR